MHRGRTDHGGSVSSAGPGWRTGDAALRAGAVLPQLLERTVLQDVDVIDLQPGLGRDLLKGLCQKIVNTAGMFLPRPTGVVPGGHVDRYKGL